MDLNSPLAIQFSEMDTDNDGKLSADEVHELLKLMGKNIYKGSINNAAKKLNYNLEGVQESELLCFTFEQFKEFFESLENSIKHSIWKWRYKVLATLKELQSEIEKSEDATAAPGHKPEIVVDSPTKGDIEITVGPTNQPYNSFIKLDISKIPKAESKPFVKVVFSLSSNENAKKLETAVKHFQTQIFNLLKADDPESSEILDCLHINTNVIDNKLNLFITSSNEALLSLGILMSEFLDRLFGQKIEGSINLKYEFNVDIEKFNDSTSDYSIYHVLARNYHAHLQWNTINVKEPLKIILSKLQVFGDLTHQSTDPALLTLLGILHTQECELKLAFDNVDNAVGELEIKNEILEGLKELKEMLGDESYKELGINEMLEIFENNFYAEASIGDWKVNLDVNIKDIKKLFEIKEGNNEQLSGEESD